MMFIPKKSITMEFNSNNIFRLAEKIKPFTNEIYVEKIVNDQITVSYGYYMPKLIFNYIFFPCLYLKILWAKRKNMSLKDMIKELKYIFIARKYKSIFNDKDRMFGDFEVFVAIMRSKL